MAMSSSKPYLVKALYEWIAENECTPFLLVNALVDGVLVPQEHVKDGQIVLNIALSAVQNFVMDNSAIAFSARFGGVPRDIYVPMHAVAGIYTRENGQGMMFEYEEPTPPPSEPSSDLERRPKKPSLKVIK